MCFPSVLVLSKPNISPVHVSVVVYLKKKKNRQSLDRASLNLELQHPPIWSWAFDCHPSPEDGKFEPCLGGVGIFEPTEYTCLFYFKPKIIILNMEEEENILHVSHTLKLL